MKILSWAFSELLCDESTFNKSKVQKHCQVCGLKFNKNWKLSFSEVDLSFEIESWNFLRMSKVKDLLQFLFKIYNKF